MTDKTYQFRKDTRNIGFSYMRTLFCLLFVIICVGACSSRADKWSKLNAYRIGDLVVEAPLAMVNSSVPLTRAADNSDNQNSTMSENEHSRDLVMLSLSISHYRNIEFGVSRNDICNNLNSGWAKQYCSDLDILYLRNLPSDVMLHLWIKDERLKGYITQAGDSMFEHILDMNFEQDPLKVTCDRVPSGRIGKSRRTCTSVLLVTPKVFAVWQDRTARFDEGEIEKVLNNTCRHGIALHRWLKQDIGIVPIYGSEKPKCPNQLSIRSNAQ